MSAPEFTDLDDDPEWDQMRELGRVCGKLARHLMAGLPLATIRGAIEPEELHLLPAALVVLKELKKARAVPIGDAPGTVLIQPHVGRA